jgi:CRISPR-associated endonuclease Csn1
MASVKKNKPSTPAKKNDEKINIGIDLGTGSLAVLARCGDQVVWHKSLLLEATTASLAERRAKRRMILTRLAHRAREYWWNECAKSAGIPVLKTITKISESKYKISAVDDRLKREHPQKGDDTIFCGALLRIMILEGKIDKLADWQVYKAVHDAIQKRGYDHEMPWKRGYKVVTNYNPNIPWVRTQGHVDDDLVLNDDEGKIAAKVGDFEEFLAEKFPNPRNHFCCYFDAYKSGLWEPEKGIHSCRQDVTADQRAISLWDGYIPPRRMIEEELKLLLDQVAKRFPKLKPLHVMFGPSLVPYGSHPRHKPLVETAKGQAGLIPGRPADWQGVLGQKIPRFDNRAVGSCALFRRFKVCKAPTRAELEIMPKTDADDRRELRLHSKFQVLTRLKNLRVIKAAGFPEPLSPEESREAFHHFEESLKWSDKEFRTWLNGKGWRLAPGALTDLRTPSPGSRGAYSRPALRVICKWLYDGWSRDEAFAHIDKLFIKGNTDPKRGLVKGDFEWIGRLKAEGWSQSFYVPHRPLNITDVASADKYVESIKYPVVRHRLGLLLKVLRELQTDLGQKGFDLSDARVGLEVISDESKETFLGAITKQKLDKRIKENDKKNQQVRKLCDGFRLQGHKDLQGFVDPYHVESWEDKGTKSEKLKETMMRGIKNGLYDIDHIVPETMGGPDEMFNKVLTRKEQNRNKKRKQTPFQMFGDSPHWRRYLEVIDQLPESKDTRLGISQFTRKLLVDPKAEELVSKRTDLQATGYIEKAAQNLVNFAFGWTESQVPGSTRHVVCIPGSMTARVRARVQVNALLYPISNKSLAEKKSGTKGEKAKASSDDSEDNQGSPKKKISPLKNREHPKHHILDAAILTFIPEWGLNPKKSHFFQMPKWADPNWFKKKVIDVHAPVQWNVSKPSLFETKKSFLEVPAKDDKKQFVSVKKHIHKGKSPSVEWTLAKLKKAVLDGMFNYPPFTKSKDSAVTKTLKKILAKNPSKLPDKISIGHNNREVQLRSLKSLEDFSAQRHLVDPNNGVTESAFHKGVFVYRDNSKKRPKWEVALVAAWSSRQLVCRNILSTLPEGQVEIWNDGQMLARGMTIEVMKPGVPNVPVGRYVISSTRENGQVALVGIKALPSINPLIIKGGMKVVSS